jgi:hypothetical protein
MKRMFGKSLKKRRQFLAGLISITVSCRIPGSLRQKSFKLATKLNAPVIAAASVIVHRLFFASRAAKTLLQIDVSDFVRRQPPLLDQFRSQHSFVRQPVAGAYRTNLKTRRRFTHSA